MKRIILMLTVAAMFVVAMAATAVPAFADPNCAQVPNNPNCHTTTTLPSGNPPNPTSNACSHNPNCETKTNFKGRPQ